MPGTAGASSRPTSHVGSRCVAADLAYARLLLAHLADPSAVIANLVNHH